MGRRGEGGREGGRVGGREGSREGDSSITLNLMNVYSGARITNEKVWFHVGLNPGWTRHRLYHTIAYTVHCICTCT